MEKIEKYFLRPLDSFTNEWVVSQILVRCINTVRISVVIYDAFRFHVALRSINYHTYITSCVKDSL